MDLGDDMNEDFNEIHDLFPGNIGIQRSPESSISSDESMDTVIFSDGSVSQPFTKR
jgi:hypothetical protein